MKKNLIEEKFCAKIFSNSIFSSKYYSNILFCSIFLLGSKDNPYGYGEDEQMDEQEVESLAQIMFDDTNEEKSEKEAAHDEEEDDATEMTAPEEKSGWLRNLFRRGSASKDDGSKSVSSVKTPMTKEQLQETIRNNPEVGKNISQEKT